MSRLISEGPPIINQIGICLLLVSKCNTNDYKEKKLKTQHGFQENAVMPFGRGIMDRSGLSI